MRKIIEKIVSQVRKSDFLVDAILAFSVGQSRTDRLINNISGYLKKGESILDIGCGACDISKRLQEKGFHVTGLDLLI